MGSLTSFVLTDCLIPGWNFGNTLEAMPNETSWGNPFSIQKLIDSAKAAGFNSIHISVSWFRTKDTAVYAVDPVWLKLIEEIFNYALNAGFLIYPKRTLGLWPADTNL